jgi:membrane protein DedA with SNARE-associated domain
VCPAAVQNARVLDSFLDAVSSSGWTYLVVFAFAYGDVLFPVLPSETSVVAAGVLAASGDLSLALIVVCAATGAILGDNTAYLIGRRLKGFVRGRLFRGEKRRHLDRAEVALADRGGSLIVIARFIPGGRSAVCFAAGVLAYSWRRFVSFDVVAGVLWATYAALIGYFGGKAFEESPLKGILVALGIAFAIAAAVEGIRWWRRRRAPARPHRPRARSPETSEPPGRRRERPNG